MKEVDYFNCDPKSLGWLWRLKLKVGELVRVNGHVYRYGVEREGKDHVLTPVD
jgi:hypothetical protein